MAYDISEAKNPMDIREQEWGTGSEIKFSNFTSCIGVIAKRGDTLYAVHLVMIDKNKKNFDDTGTRRVIEIFPKFPEKITVFGCITYWENKDNGVKDAFQKLLGQMKDMSVEKYQQYTFGNGTYGAKVVGKDIEITY